MRNGGYVKHRIEVSQRVVAGMVAERSFHAPLLGVYPTFDHDLCIFRHLEIHSFCWHQGNRFFSEKPGKKKFIHARRQGSCGRIGEAGSPPSTTATWIGRFCSAAARSCSAPTL